MTLNSINFPGLESRFESLSPRTRCTAEAAARIRKAAFGDWGRKWDWSGVHDLEDDD